MIQRINRKHDKSSSKKRSGFVYRERSPDSVKKRAEQTGGRFDSIFKSGFDTFKPASGTNTVRFLPPTWDGHDHYGLDIYVHGFVGPNRGSYLCLQKMKNKPCPLCKLEEEMRKEGETEEANKVGARKRVLTWIIDRDGDDDTPLLWSMGWTVDREISDLARNKKTGETLLIDHPDEGFDVSFTRKGERLNTDYYGWQIDRDSSPITEKQRDQDEIMEYVQEHPLPDVLQYVSAEKLEQVVEGTAEEPDEDAEEDRPRRKGRARDEDDDTVEDEDEDRPARKKARRDAEDDEEQDDSDRSDRRRARSSRRRDEDDEEQEDEAPRTKKSRRDRDLVDDDSEEDGSATDDDERPAKKRSARDESDEDEEEDRPHKKARREEPDEDEEEDKPRRRARDDDDEDGGDEKPAKRVRTRPSRDEDEEEDERPRKKRSRDEEEDE